MQESAALKRTFRYKTQKAGYSPAFVDDSAAKMTGRFIFSGKMIKTFQPNILESENDAIILEADMRRTGQYYSVEAEIFPGMTHCLMLETGWQKIANRIIGWLDSMGI